MKKYNIIYADPPWSFNFQNRNGLSDEAKGRLYPTMKSQDIVDLPVSSIADEDCVLFLWVMNSEIPLALRCISSWGFTFKTVAFNWTKTTVTAIVELCGDLPRVELFCRYPAEGWDVWGNEVESDIDLTPPQIDLSKDPIG